MNRETFRRVGSTAVCEFRRIGRGEHSAPQDGEKKLCGLSDFSLVSWRFCNRSCKCVCFLATALKRVRLYTLQVIDSTFAADFRKIAGNLPASGSIAKYLRVERKKVLAIQKNRCKLNLQAGRGNRNGPQATQVNGTAKRPVLSRKILDNRIILKRET